MARSLDFSFRTRAKNLEQLSRDQFDVLVIGGGITGAGIARDAALRGLRVALVERRDFAVGTSSRSSKLIHGGVRYLQQGDVGLVMEAANERRVLRRLAPHLARPIHMLVPVHSRPTYAKLSVGLWTFDRMARVLEDERYRMVNRDETLALEPLLRPKDLYGAGLYFEYLTDDARLVLDTLKSAAALGAVVTNYSEVTGLAKDNGKLSAAMVKDSMTGGECSVRAKVIVNAAGPWVDAVRLLEGEGETPRLHLTKGIHLVLRRERLTVSRIVVMNTSDHRAVFVVPHGDVVYIGTTDTDYDGRYDDPWITAEDVTYLLDAANATFDVDRLTESDVVGAWAGLRPLLHQEGKTPTEISRRDEIMVGPTGMISIAGGKLTTYRKMAERVVEMATINGARCALWEDEIGSLEVGKKADITLLNTRAPQWQPLYNPVSNLVYSATGASVDTVICNGKILVQGGRTKTLDEDRIYREVRRLMPGILSKTKLEERIRPKWPVL